MPPKTVKKAPAKKSEVADKIEEVKKVKARKPRAPKAKAVESDEVTVEPVESPKKSRAPKAKAVAEKPKRTSKWLEHLKPFMAQAKESYGKKSGTENDE